MEAFVQLVWLMRYSGIELVLVNWEGCTFLTIKSHTEHDKRARYFPTGLRECCLYHIAQICFADVNVLRCCRVISLPHVLTVCLCQGSSMESSPCMHSSRYSVGVARVYRRH